MTCRPVGVVALSLLIGWGAGVRLAAQQAESPFSGKKTIDLQRVGEDKIVVARRLIKAKKYQPAADLLELVYESDPDNGLVQNLLRNCYDHLQQYAKAEILTRRILQKTPNSIGHLLYLAETLVKLDNTAEALEVFDRVLQAIPKTDPARYQILVSSLVRSGLDDQALAIIMEARQQSGRSDLFATERGGIFEKQRDYLSAAQEYRQMLIGDTSRQANSAERRLMALLAFEESAVVVEEFLVGGSDSTTDLRTMKLLADHFLKAGRFEDAFTYVLRQDSLEGGTGYPLVSFMRRCQERRCWSQAAGMAEIILRQHPQAGFELEVSFEYARALAELQRPVEALAVYNRLFGQTEDQQTRADALYGAGVIYLDYLNDGQAALIYFDSVTANYPRGRSYFLSWKAAALCQLRQGRLADARRRFADMGGSRLPEEMHEEVMFYLGLVDFFEMKYDSAQAALRKLTVDHPQGFYVNDALQLVLAMREAADAEPALNAYSTAHYLLFRGKADSARARLIEIADGNPPVLGDIALHTLIGLELAQDDSGAVIQAVERLAREHPESYYRPLGLKIKADMLADSPEHLAEAKELYRTLLENYPEYPFAREIRDRLRRLEESQPVG